MTLGGTGKETGDRHPKVSENVLIGASATILGNIKVRWASAMGLTDKFDACIIAFYAGFQPYLQQAVLGRRFGYLASGGTICTLPHTSLTYIHVPVHANSCRLAWGRRSLPDRWC